MRIVQIVRRFGPMGGMERYAWELSRQLAELGHEVTVVCERCHAPEESSRITIHELGEVRPRPRWLAHLRFSRRLAHWLQQNPQPGTVIHSHERTGIHHITTIHGPPFAEIRHKPLWKRVSLRIAAQLWLEQREVCGSQVQAVVPNSDIIADMLGEHYPCIGGRMADPIPPGVSFQFRQARRTVPPADGGAIGFVGVEWKRKGLDVALAVFIALRQRRPQLKLYIAGPGADEIRHLLPTESGGIHCLGRVDTRELYPQLDLLLHPARQEPYGMVIAEAMAAGVPVVASAACGAAADIVSGNGSVLPLSATTEQWAGACDHWLSIDTEVRFNRPWEDVARDYVNLYESLSAD